MPSVQSRRFGCGCLIIKEKALYATACCMRSTAGLLLALILPLSLRAQGHGRHTGTELTARLLAPTYNNAPHPTNRAPPT
jgi:hypothetical protein